MKTLIVHRKGSNDNDFFYNVSEVDIKRVSTDWEVYAISSSPSKTRVAHFESDLGRTSMIFSEVAGITVKDEV